MIAAAVLLAVALIPDAAPKKKTIHVADNFFAPKAVTVARNATVTWTGSNPAPMRNSGSPRPSSRR